LFVGLLLLLEFYSLGNEFVSVYTDEDVAKYRAVSRELNVKSCQKQSEQKSEEDIQKSFESHMRYGLDYTRQRLFDDARVEYNHFFHVFKLKWPGRTLSCSKLIWRLKGFRMKMKSGS